MLKAETVELIRQGLMKKGDVLAVAKIAGIMGAKKTSELIPLCHPIALTQVEVDLQLNDDPAGGCHPGDGAYDWQNRGGNGSPDGCFRGGADCLRYGQSRGEDRENPERAPDRKARREKRGYANE